MNYDYQEVQRWLEDVLGKEDVPDYKINDRTLSILHQMMVTNLQNDANINSMCQDYEQKTKEYEAEASRVKHVLQKTGIEATKFPQQATTMIQGLATLASLLELKDISTSSYLLGLGDLAEVIKVTDKDRTTEHRMSASLLRNTTQALHKLNDVTQALDKARELEKSHATTTRKQEKNTQFLRMKCNEYESQIQQQEFKLAEAGVDSSVHHGALVSQAQELADLQSKIGPLKKKLENYHSLPADFSLAQLKVEELRKQVEALEFQLCQSIDTMHM
ncbi:PREDICTED: HAUS augmin-like complex subunit 1 [Priapulus caudatus]|uniref:HAUS augmin-like complex subunit 1 n=1 Tax=Priapulus caudatus TaxID=37621 RepID=A0ABM1ECE6_PRICU|nr:PREDICTED: HAUS augmin-like complex subunit 1 [Priapulus caudatus]